MLSEKHRRRYIRDCLRLAAEASTCVRPGRRFGAILVDPANNVPLMNGYNGGPRGGSQTCGPDGTCLRETMRIESGTRLEVGCAHAESNVVANAARLGVRCLGMWLFVTGEPCLMCAKAIHHAGIARVLVIRGGYNAGNDGVTYLEAHGVAVEYVEGERCE